METYPELLKILDIVGMSWFPCVTSVLHGGPQRSLWCGTLGWWGEQGNFKEGVSLL